MQITKLQRVQNAAARLIIDIPKFSHITAALYELHRLPVAFRISFKILIRTFKSIHVCSSNSLVLEVPQKRMRPTLGGRSFTTAAPALM